MCCHLDLLLVWALVLGAGPVGVAGPSPGGGINILHKKIYDEMIMK